MTTSHTRLTPAARTAQLIDVALKLAAKHGLANIRRDQIAEAADVSQGLVTERLGTMIEMRRTIMRQAVAREVLPVIAEGLACKDRAAMKAPAELKARALASLA